MVVERAYILMTRQQMRNLNAVTIATATPYDKNSVFVELSDGTAVMLTARQIAMIARERMVRKAAESDFLSGAGDDGV